MIQQQLRDQNQSRREECPVDSSSIPVEKKKGQHFYTYSYSKDCSWGYTHNFSDFMIHEAKRNKSKLLLRKMTALFFASAS